MDNKKGKDQYFIKINTEDCINCGTCLGVCPNNVEKLAILPHKPDFHTETLYLGAQQGCNGCGACIEVCPVDVISYFWE